MSKDLLFNRLEETDEQGLYQVFHEITNNPKSIDGFSKLVQVAERYLLMTPGSDIFRPNDGGGILSLLRSNVDPSNISNLTSKISTAVGAVRSQIIQSQSDGNLPLDEQLQDLFLVDLSVEESGTRISIRVGVQSKSGKQEVTIIP